jgi:putative phosphoesterase
VRIAVLSDIHGNLHALDRCLTDVKERGGADVIVAAGDLCKDGPKPRGVVKRLRSIGAQCVRGNTDRMVGVEDLETLEPEDARGAQWVRDKLGPEATAWLAQLPLTVSFGDDENGLLIFHATPQRDDEHIWPDAADEQLERIFSDVAQRTVAFGHLHVPYVRMWRGRTLVNVASAGLPKDGDPRAHYALFTRRSDGWEVQPRRVAFDVKKVERQLRASGIPDLKQRILTLRRHRYPKLAPPGSVIP